jgi:enoyl-CoA hydratase
MIDVTQRGRITVLTLAHGKANALDTELCDELSARFDALSADKNCAAVVLTGQGKIFCAGVDLLRAAEGGRAYMEKFLPALRKSFDLVFACRKPVIAALNGHAVAGGCVLACCADRRLMARDSGRIGVTELQVGLPFPANALEVMRAVTTPRYFHEVMFNARTYAPADAHTRGLIDTVVEPDRLLDEAVGLAEMLAALRPEAFAQTKQHWRQPVLDRLAKDGAKFDAAVDAVWLAPETSEHIRGYVARTFKKVS